MFIVTTLFFLSTCLLNQFTTNGWELAVASEGRLDLISKEGSVLNSITSPELAEARGLALDATRNIIFFSNTKPSNGNSIFYFRLSATGKNYHVIPLISTSPGDEYIQSLAYDPVDCALYWTDNLARTISWCPVPDEDVDKPLEGQLLHKFRDEMPQGLVIDHCRRYLFWSNINHRRPSIERSQLDGSGRTVIVNTGLFQPHGLTLDLRGEGRLYWGNDLEGIHYSIERSRLDGSGREELLQGKYHMPFSIALVENYLLWSDWSHGVVWSLDLNVKKSIREEKMIFKMDDHKPFGILAYRPGNLTCSIEISGEHQTEAPEIEPTNATYTEEKKDNNCELASQFYCLAGGKLDAPGICQCPEGFMGTHCEINLCQNFCLNGGHCTPGLPPTCTCLPGKSGARCEIDPCFNYCHNDGKCQYNPLSKTRQIKCHCDPRFTGPRCEIRRDICGDNCDCTEGSYPCSCSRLLSGNNTNNVTVAMMESSVSHFNLYISVLSSITTALLITIILLVWKVVRLSKRPRIRRRVVVSRKEMPVPSGRGVTPGEEERGAPNSRPNSDTCEITIENCCNMNICETPCFEPPVRTPGKKSKREEKKTLLSNMEEPDDSPDGNDQ